MRGGGKSWIVTVSAIIGIVVFGMVLVIQTRSFSGVVDALAESDIRERTEFAAATLSAPLSAGDTNAVREFCDSKHRQCIRVTVVNPDGSVLYDTDSATGNHLLREEIHQAFNGASGMVLRRSETLGSYQLYCARRVGDKVVRLAVPYNGVQEPVRLARHGLVTAGLVGALVVTLTVSYTHLTLPTN